MNDTIAAISTAPGASGIGIIRISGPCAFEIAAKLFYGSKPFESIGSHTISHGFIIDPATGEDVDEALVSKMEAPRTYTREDVVEINSHGGTAVLRRILGLCAAFGARMAQPGEFTKRAFLNGRIDLSQAEAVIDIINARTERSSRAAMEQLEGRLSKKLRSLRDKLLDLLAHIEATVDFPEHDMEAATGGMVREETVTVEKELMELVRGFDRGRIIREGITVAIAGRPNVGKSSLLNALAGRNRAIVTEIPGTTRDVIEECVNMEGIPVLLVDTAGIRPTGDMIERIGVERAKQAAKNADMVLLVVDSTQGFGAEEAGILKELRQQGHRYIIVFNKTDLVAENIKGRLQSAIPAGARTTMVSATESIGMEELGKEIVSAFLHDEKGIGQDTLVTNIRHKTLLEEAVRHVKNACEACDAGVPLDCASIDLREAIDAIGGITGESVGEEVLDRIFSRFCIGK